MGLHILQYSPAQEWGPFAPGRASHSPPWTSSLWLNAAEEGSSEHEAASESCLPLNGGPSGLLNEERRDIRLETQSQLYSAMKCSRSSGETLSGTKSRTYFHRGLCCSIGSSKMEAAVHHPKRENATTSSSRQTCHIVLVFLISMFKHAHVLLWRYYLAASNLPFPLKGL